MKKLLLGSAALLMFSCAILIFQISCKKDAMAQSPTSTTNKILIFKRIIGNFDGPFETWIANYDGSNATQILASVPGWKLSNPKLAPDGSKIFFIGSDSTTINTTSLATEIFSSNIDGSNVQRITNNNSSGKATDLWDVN